MGQLRRDQGAQSGPKMTDDEVNRYVRDYSSTSYKPKPVAQPGGKTKTGTTGRKQYDGVHDS